MDFSLYDISFLDVLRFIGFCLLLWFALFSLQLARYNSERRAKSDEIESVKQALKSISDRNRLEK